MLSATVTPLASIFGSGFLIIVPVLERRSGPAVVGGRRLPAGLVRRHRDPPQRRHGRAARREGKLDDGTARRAVADFVIAIAYVISVALYLRIMAQYVVDFVSTVPLGAERASPRPRSSA